MDKTLQQLQGEIACLETHVDMLETELSYLNEMLIRCGFPEGIATLKMTVMEVLEEDEIQQKHELS